MNVRSNLNGNSQKKEADIMYSVKKHRWIPNKNKGIDNVVYDELCDKIMRVSFRLTNENIEEIAESILSNTKLSIKTC